MKRLLSILSIFCIFGLTTGTFVLSAPTPNERSPIVQGTLMEIDGPFFIIMDKSGKRTRCSCR